ncbi:hypothetical protein NDA17_004248 [Ustilago hordei]|nr:hypothetical protein NDA17_004248 [Ustilago hordei]
MGRGRRPNMALEPTRALQTQRAFRQRKAEHLASLEESVAKLTDENAKLRKLLNLPPTPKEDVGDRSRSSSPTRAGVPTPTSTESAQSLSGGCDNCERMREANRQLALAAAQVEEQMSHLQQSIKALRSVLQHHNIPIPSPLVGSTGSPVTAAMGEKVYRHTKKTRYSADPLLQPQLPLLSDASPSTTAVSGIQMTSNYLGAALPSSAVASHEQYHQQQQQYASSSRRPNPITTSGTQAWHTPSPSAILSAPTPPSASFSPRHAYINHNNSAHPSQAEESYYKSRHPPARQNSGNSTSGSGSSSGSGSNSRQLPPPNAGVEMSPARQAAHLPPWSGHGHNGAIGVSSPASMGRYHLALPALSPHSNGNWYHSPSSWSYPSTSTEAGPSEGYARSSTSNGRRGEREDYAYEPQQQQYTYGGRYARIAPLSSAASPSYAAAQSPYDPHQQAVASPRYPPRDRDDSEAGGAGRYVASNYGSVSSHRSSGPGERDQKSKRGPPNASNGDTQVKKICCPPKASLSSSTGAQALSRGCGPKAEQAKPDEKNQANWTAPPPLGVTFDMRIDAKKQLDNPDAQPPATLEDGKAQDDDECCFGLINCDDDGRIVI